MTSYLIHRSAYPGPLPDALCNRENYPAAVSRSDDFHPERRGGKITLAKKTYPLSIRRCWIGIRISLLASGRVLKRAILFSSFAGLVRRFGWERTRMST